MAKKSEDKSKSLFDHLNQIRFGKDPNYYNELTESEKKGFSQFIILTGLSMDKTCIEEVSTISKYLNLIPNEHFYKLCCALIPSNQKFSKWIKNNTSKINSEVTEYVAKYYEIGKDDAHDYCELMMDCEEKTELINILSKYGLSEKEIKGLLK